MTMQEQALRAYYTSMTDADLLRTAANKKSFIEVAQKVLAEELLKRHLGESAEGVVPVQAASPSAARWRFFRR